MISRVIWLLLTFLFGLLTFAAGKEVVFAWSSKDWPTTQGVVVAFFGTPQYNFSVNNRSYTSSVASCNDLFEASVIRNSSRYALAYPLGAKVTVHYRPKDPALAVLETQFDSSGWLFVGGLLLLTFMCITGYVLGWKFRLRFSQP